MGSVRIGSVWHLVAALSTVTSQKSSATSPLAFPCTLPSATPPRLWVHAFPTICTVCIFPLRLCFVYLFAVSADFVLYVPSMEHKDGGERGVERWVKVGWKVGEKWVAKTL